MDGDESVKTKLARIDERTHAIESKIDRYMGSVEEKLKDHEGKIENLSAWKNWLAGVGAVIVIFLGVLFGVNDFGTR